MTNLNDDNKQFETFSLIWLDSIHNETQQTEQSLRSIINYFKKFDNIEICQNYIENTTKNDRIIFIVNDQYGQEIIPSIHKFRQVISIYIYCIDKTIDEQWSFEFSKVKGIIVNVDELISRIRRDHQIRKKLEEPLSINVFSTDGQTAMELNGEFVYSQILNDCLLRLTSTQTDKRELIEFCRKQYKDNPQELDHIQEFDLEYSPDKALWWYTRESFFYKTLNAALRIQNIHIMFLFRSYMFDICQQLKEYQSKETLKVYRSQLMSNEELEKFRKYIGQLISVNSFFSTSQDRKTALFLLGDPDSVTNYEKILFEIVADPQTAIKSPFADIREHSEFIQESEVLFMQGSIFRLENINPTDGHEHIWTIKLTLSNDSEHKLKPVLTSMKKELEMKDINLRVLAKLVWKMSKLDLAEKYLLRRLKEISPNWHDGRVRLYRDLEELSSQRNNRDLSVEWHKKALEFKRLNPQASNSRNLCVRIDTKWNPIGITFVGETSYGNQLNQLHCPSGFCFNIDDESIYIADTHNNRIIKWIKAKNIGEIIAESNLNEPRDVLLDNDRNSLIICDYGNRRVVEWSLENKTYLRTIIPSIACNSAVMDKNRHLYVSDGEKHEVKRWIDGDVDGVLVAGGHGQGGCLNQLNDPRFIFVDDECSVYVCDRLNYRVVKWTEGAKEGIVVAGGHGKGSSSSQLNCPCGLAIDADRNIYVADSHNNRVMCWPPNSHEGYLIVGGNGQGSSSSRFNGLRALVFDQKENLYVADHYNHRIQVFYRNL